MVRRVDSSITSAIEATQQGDDDARNSLLENLSPHVLRAAGMFLGRHITISDDEYSVGLLALNEAIDKYSPHKGASFITFFETVLKRRLIDHIRKTSRIQEVPLSGIQPSEQGENYTDTIVEIREAEQRFQDQVLVADRAAEIAALSQELERFGLSFSDLPDNSPKHRDARSTAFRLAAILARDGTLMEGFLQSRQLPVSVLSERAAVNRKTVERNRKYIIAVTLILGGDYPLLSQYIGGV